MGMMWKVFFDRPFDLVFKLVMWYDGISTW